ncbi:1419_t:CDS:2 [Dentiscutata erythropus]|uniref:1419_t:CDS:1 n=1 Tax=Dentiscutata erythropus TaxID=1348616 RepID=A0A9N9HUD3_9GLOM|nr:1419_t:CDS:2 [Dentiscutata erythropus]
MSVEFLKSLSNDFAKLLFNVEDYNVIIKVGKSPNILHFKAHSCVLRARSTYFHSALSSDWVKTDGNFIVYLYSGTICLENQNPTRIIDLIAAADELILTELVNYLKDHLLTHHDQWILDQNIISDNLFDSNLIKFKHATVISNWIDRVEDPEQTRLYRKSPSHSFNLLLRGSRDGFSARKFHELCKDKGSTVVIMKVAGTGEIIGGYNPENWKGGFFDLWMSNYNNLSKGCSCRNSYYEKNIIDSQEFDLDDYEVFQIFQNQPTDEKEI